MMPLPRFALAMALLALASTASAQSPSSNTRAGKAVISGENPYIRLLDKEGGKTLTQVSFWRVHWSPVGPGHVCYITVGDAGEAGAMRFALYDNAKLYDYITNDIMAVTNRAYVDRPFERVGNATFGPEGNTITDRVETCRSAKYTVRLAWHGLQTPELIDILPGSRPNNPFGLTFLNIVGTTADVTINGQRAPGTTFGAGSALAFGETWLRK